MKSNRMKTLKIVGALVALVGWGIGLIGASIDDAKMEEAVSEEVTRQLDEREKAEKKS